MKQFSITTVRTKITVRYTTGLAVSKISYSHNNVNTNTQSNENNAINLLVGILCVYLHIRKCELDVSLL